MSESVCMKGASILFTIVLFVLAAQIGSALKRTGALPAQNRDDGPGLAPTPFAVLPAYSPGPEATVSL